MPDFSFTWSALEELECHLREIRRRQDVQMSNLKIKMS